MFLETNFIAFHKLKLIQCLYSTESIFWYYRDLGDLDPGKLNTYNDTNISQTNPFTVNENIT